MLIGDSRKIMEVLNPGCHAVMSPASQDKVRWKVVWHVPHPILSASSCEASKNVNFCLLSLLGEDESAAGRGNICVVPQ